LADFLVSLFPDTWTFDPGIMALENVLDIFSGSG
jgi:hypothetical protein